MVSVSHLEDTGERGEVPFRAAKQCGVRAPGLGSSVCTSLPGLGFRGFDRRVEENADGNPVYPFPPGLRVWGHPDPVILSQNSPLLKSLCHQPPASPVPPRQTRSFTTASLHLCGCPAGPRSNPPSSSSPLQLLDISHTSSSSPHSPCLPHPFPSQCGGSLGGGGGVDHLRGQLPEFTGPTTVAAQAWPL